MVEVSERQLARHHIGEQERQRLPLGLSAHQSGGGQEDDERRGHAHGPLRARQDSHQDRLHLSVQQGRRGHEAHAHAPKRRQDHTQARLRVDRAGAGRDYDDHARATNANNVGQRRRCPSFDREAGADRVVARTRRRPGDAEIRRRANARDDDHNRGGERSARNTGPSSRRGDHRDAAQGTRGGDREEGRGGDEGGGR